MRLVKKIDELKKIVEQEKKEDRIIGFVPTMGYLHAGHISLVRIAKKRSQFVVVSIFVNPPQFGPREDFKRYPRDLKRDVVLLKKEGVDLVFFPSVRVMYPADYKTHVEVQDLGKVLCGISRPGHFRGVTTVVLKLFNLVEPDIAVFGRKDYQQLEIIKRMVKDLNLDVKILCGKVIREKDGLAISSRNTYLSKTERQNGLVLYDSLQWVKKVFKKGFDNPIKAINKMCSMIQQKGGRIDYIEAVNRKTLKPVKKLKKGTVIALAVYFGETRLIDNTIL